MTKTYRELTGKEKRQIKKLVVSQCANYDRRTVNEPTVLTSAPQKQDASKRRQECVSTEKRNDSKTLCNELASEMP